MMSNAETINSERLRNFVTFRLSRVQSRLNAQAIRILKAHSELSLTEWRIVLLTAQAAGSTLSELARDTHLDKGQLSRAITTLTKKKLLLSKTDKNDQRQHNLTLTKSGQAEYKKMLPIMRERQKNLVANLSSEDLEHFSRVLVELEQAVAKTES